MLESSAEAPMAVLRFPVVLLNRATNPMAVLSAPLLSFRRAESPSAVLLFGYPPSGAGVTARALAENTKQVTMSALRCRLARNSDWLIRGRADARVFVNLIE